MIAEGLGCAPREVSVIMKLWLATVWAVTFCTELLRVRARPARGRAGR